MQGAGDPPLPAAGGGRCSPRCPAGAKREPGTWPRAALVPAARPGPRPSPSPSRGCDPPGLRPTWMEATDIRDD